MSLVVEAKKIADRAVLLPLASALRVFDRVRGRAPRVAIVSPRRILFVKLWGLGNLAMILPLLRRAKETFPDARIDLLTLEGNRALLEDVPAIDRLHLLRPDGLLRPVADLFRAARVLRRRRYDLVLDFEQFLRVTALLTRAIAPAFSIGFATPGQGRQGVHDVDVPHLGRRHMAVGFSEIARAAGVAVDDVPLPEVPRNTAAARDVERMLATRLSARSGSPLVVVHCGSGDNFPGRRWPVERFAALADQLSRAADATILLTGTEAERSLTAALARALPDHVAYVDLAGQLELRALIELIARVDLVVTNDTAPVHLADAVGTPLVAIYGPNTPTLYGPRGPESRAFWAGLGCSPCITNRNAKTSFCRRRLCLETIHPPRVAAAALTMLERRRLRQGAPETVIAGAVGAEDR